MEILVKFVLIFILIFDVPSLVVVAPSNMPWRKTNDLLGLISSVLCLPCFLLLHEVVSLLQLISGHLLLLLSVLVVLESGVLVSLEQFCFFVHLLLLS